MQKKKEMITDISNHKSKPRIRHTMLRVKDLNASIEFYEKVLEMKVFRESKNENQKYTVVFLGYGDEDKDPAIELTYNWGQDAGYDLGTGYGHVAIGVPDIYEVCRRVQKLGMKVPRPPGPLKGRGPNGPIIAFISDPDGYLIELGERP